jgi:apolipoprotein N-acyltransferase
MAGELIRSFLFSGLPWMLLAYSVTPVPLLARSASLAGALFVSGWLAALNSSLLTAATAGRRRNSVAFTASLVAALAAQAGLSGAGAAGPGSIRVVGERAAGRGQGVRTLLVQGNLANADRRDPAAALRGLRSLVALSTAEPDVDLAIWPENAVSAILPFNEGLLQQVTDGAGPFPRNLLVGAPRADPANPARIQTSAVLLDSERRAVDHHDKVQLLPFAEVVPWPFSALGRGRIQPVPGARPRVLEADAAKLGPLICYEVLFPKISRSLVRDGAGVLVNLSNDSWFGTTAGLEQHLAAAVLRAIEFRRPLLRATSSGITAAIDAGGRVVARLPVGNAGTLRVDVTPGEGLTPYARSGDAVAWAALLVTAFLALRESAGRHDRGSAEPPVAKPGVPSR